jgi:polar amino acid transport system substrate-binding protein
MKPAVFLMLMAALGIATTARTEAAAPAGLAPSGTLRAVYIAANTAQAVQDKTSGEVRGASADIARELARREGVPVTITPLGSAAAVLGAVQNGAADIGFVAPNAERVGVVLYTQPYMRVLQTFLVKADSPLQSVRDLDRPGNTVGANVGDSMALYLKTNFKQARLLESPDFSMREAAGWLADGRVIAFGGGRQRLGAATRGMPGLRLLTDNLYGVPQTIAVAADRPDLQKRLDAVLDELRTSGFIQRALQNSGVDGVEVAAAAATP